MAALRVLLVDDAERDLRTLERTLPVVGAEIDVVGTAPLSREIALDSIGEVLDGFAAGEPAPSTDQPAKTKRGHIRRS